MIVEYFDCWDHVFWFSTHKEYDKIDTATLEFDTDIILKDK